MIKFHIPGNRTLPPCGAFCSDRALGCRASCEKWKAYEQKKAAEYEERVFRQRTIYSELDTRRNSYELNRSFKRLSAERGYGHGGRNFST